MAYGLSTALSPISPYRLSLSHLLQPASAVLLLCAPLAFPSPIAFFTQPEPLMGLCTVGSYPRSFLTSKVNVP